jgi:hypothetical protein
MNFGRVRREVLEHQRQLSEAPGRRNEISGRSALWERQSLMPIRV